MARFNAVKYLLCVCAAQNPFLTQQNKTCSTCCNLLAHALNSVCTAETPKQQICTLRWTVPTAGAFGLSPALHWTRAARPKAAGTRICALCATQTQLARSFDPRPGRACRGNSPKPQPSAALDACSTRCGCCRATFIAALDASQMRRAGARHATSHAASSAVLDASSTRRGWRHATSSADVDAASIRRGWLHATVSAAADAVRSSSEVHSRPAGAGWRPYRPPAGKLARIVKVEN